MTTIQWLHTNKVRLIDQTRLPQEEVYLETGDYREVAAAIREMRIRGAPALGVAAAFGLALGALGIKDTSKHAFLAELHQVQETLAATRPTARNLFWALERMEKVAAKGRSPKTIQAALVAEAQRLAAEDIAANRALGRHGAELLEDGLTVLTHCNAGALATAGYGTALGVLRAAQEAGKRLKVISSETRPLLQGARLTAWELLRDGFDVTLITDSMAGHFMRQGRIQAVLVGADRIASNGDTANKIGTYTHAVLAREHGIPFYVAAPTSTVDLSLATGEAIPIEERRPEEVTHLAGVPTAPTGVKAANPAFDVTPHYYIDAIITEKGVLREPYEERLGKLCAT